MQVENFCNEFLPKCSKIFNENLKLLFDNEVVAQHLEIQKIQPNQFGQSFPLPIVVSNIQVEHDYQGNGYLVFSKEDAILVGCLLAEIGEAAMEEKITSKSFSNDEFDGYKEICNQIIGLLDQVFVDLVPQKIHLKQMDHVKVEDEKDLEKISEMINDETYLLNFPFQLDFDKKYQANLYLVLPNSFVTQFLDEEFKDKNRSESDSQPFDELEVLLINVDGKKESGLKSIFDDFKIPCIQIESFSRLKELAQQNSKKLVVIEANQQILKGIDICNNISKVIRNLPIPIWLQGNSWNSFCVYKATLAGANYVLVSPINKNVVKRRLLQMSSAGKIAA